MSIELGGIETTEGAQLAQQNPRKLNPILNEIER